MSIEHAAENKSHLISIINMLYPPTYMYSHRIQRSQVIDLFSTRGWFRGINSKPGARSFLYVFILQNHLLIGEFRLNMNLV